jgi:hypothetical protein
MLHNLGFIFVALIFMVIGRYMGWGLSKSFLYGAPIILSFIAAVGWGIAVGWSMSGLLEWLHPNVIFKWSLGFGLAAYVAVPNYGLFHESTIPDQDQPRHMMISWVPMVSYIITEFAMPSLAS